MSMNFAPFDPLYSACEFVGGLLVGMTGMGGGSLMTPLLILLFGVPWWAAARSLDGSQSNSIMSVPRTIALAIVVIRAIGPGNAAVTRVGR